MTHPKSYFLIILESFLGVYILVNLLSLPYAVSSYLEALHADNKTDLLLTSYLFYLNIFTILASIFYFYKLITFSKRLTLWTWIFFTIPFVRGWIYFFFDPIAAVYIEEYVFKDILIIVVICSLVTWRIRVLRHIVPSIEAVDKNTVVKSHITQFLIVALIAISLFVAYVGPKGILVIAKGGFSNIKRVSIVNSVIKENNEMKVISFSAPKSIKMYACAGLLETGDYNDPKFQMNKYEQYFKAHPATEGIEQNSVSVSPGFVSCVIPEGNIVFKNSITATLTSLSVYIDKDHEFTKLFDLKESFPAEIGGDKEGRLYVVIPTSIGVTSDVRLYYINLENKKLEVVDRKGATISLCGSTKCQEYPMQH